MPNDNICLQEAFERECAGFPGFVTKFRTTTEGKFSVSNDPDTVDYENYRSVQISLSLSMFRCLLFFDVVPPFFDVVSTFFLAY